MAGGFPTRASAGLPAGWQPVTQVTGDYHVRTAGAVVSDLRITNGTIYVEAPNVTLNRIQGIGAYVNNAPGSTCNANLLVENSTFTPNGTTAMTRSSSTAATRRRTSSSMVRPRVCGSVTGARTVARSR